MNNQNLSHTLGDNLRKGFRYNQASKSKTQRFFALYKLRSNHTGMEYMEWDDQ